MPLPVLHDDWKKALLEGSNPVPIRCLFLLQGSASSLQIIALLWWVVTCSEMPSLIFWSLVTGCLLISPVVPKIQGDCRLMTDWWPFGTISVPGAGHCKSCQEDALVILPSSPSPLKQDETGQMSMQFEQMLPEWLMCLHTKLSRWLTQRKWDRWIQNEGKMASFQTAFSYLEDPNEELILFRKHGF